MLQRWFWAIVVVALLLVSAVPAAAQTPDDQACVRKGGTWDAAAETCVIAAEIEITIPYPMQFVGMPYAEQALDGFIDARRAQFLGAMIEYGPMPSPGPLVMDMSYELFEHGDAYTSVVYTIYEYTGGAHGNTYFQTFISDHVNQRVLGLDDLFTDTGAALDTIAPMVQDDIRTQLGDMADAAWLEDGAGPVDANYQNAALTSDALVFYFPPYQVAAYAAGSFTVELPLAAVDHLLAISLE